MFKTTSTRLQKVLTKKSLNPNVIKAEYAVRGKVVTEAEKLRSILKNKSEKLPFDELVFCNIGNPQQLGQQPITFFRNVLSCVVSPELCEKSEIKKLFKPDVIERAKNLLSNMDGNSGAYTHSQGLGSIRQSVANFIEKRDNIQYKVDPDYIFLTDGASVGVRLILKAMISSNKDGVMVPIPQYPLYSAGIQLYGGSQVNYYLNEEDNWGLSVDELNRAYEEATKRSVSVKGLVIINPGNPTGQVLSKQNMKEVIDFCAQKKIVLCADEVYQENIYGDTPFYSFNKVVDEMGLSDTFEMISFHSVSKGFLGECGRRGGYFQLSKAIDKEVKEQFYKVASINLCPNIDGQVMMDLMVNPPGPGSPSHEQYIAERDAILQSLKCRATNLVNTLNTLEGVKCNPAAGAMYAFPQITIPTKAVQEATSKGMQPDLFYSLQLLGETGLVVVPGSGFGQKDGTFHFRTTFLPPEEKINAVLGRLRTFHENFMNKYR